MKLRESRLRELIIEDVSDLDRLAEDCQYFIEKNENMLFKDFYLLRGSRKNYGIVKKGFRRRKKVFSPGLFYFYNQFKPSDVPKRDELLPCFGDVIKGHFAHMNSYLVFPVGSNYQMYYHPEVDDFNYNDIIDDYNLGSAPYKELYRKMENVYMEVGEIIRNGGGDEFPEDFFEDLQRVRNLYAHDDMEIVEIYRVYDVLVDILHEHWNIFDQHYPEVIRVYEEYRDYFKNYFSGLKSTQKLEDEMSGKEVMLYCPDGFYYLPFEQSIKVDELI